MTSSGDIPGSRVFRATSAAAYLTVSAQYTDTDDIHMGHPLIDRVKVEVVSVVLGIFGMADYEKETRAASVPVNDDYDEGNVHPISGEPVSDNNGCTVWLWMPSPDCVIAPGIVRLLTTTWFRPRDGLRAEARAGSIGSRSRRAGLLPSPNSAFRATINTFGFGLPDGTPVPRTRESAALTMAERRASRTLIEGLTKYYDSMNHGIGWLPILSRTAITPRRACRRTLRQGMSLSG